MTGTDTVSPPPSACSAPEDVTKAGIDGAPKDVISAASLRRYVFVEVHVMLCVELTPHDMGGSRCGRDGATVKRWRLRDGGRGSFLSDKSIAHRASLLQVVTLNEL